MCSDFCILTAENAKAGCTAGSVAGGHTTHAPGMNVTGLCARFAPTIKWHRIALCYKDTCKRDMTMAGTSINNWEIDRLQ